MEVADISFAFTNVAVISVVTLHQSLLFSLPVDRQAIALAINIIASTVARVAISWIRIVPTTIVEVYRNEQNKRQTRLMGK